MPTSLRSASQTSRRRTPRSRIACTASSTVADCSTMISSREAIDAEGRLRGRQALGDRADHDVAVGDQAGHGRAAGSPPRRRCPGRAWPARPRRAWCRRAGRPPAGSSRRRLHVSGHDSRASPPLDRRISVTPERLPLAVTTPRHVREGHVARVRRVRRSRTSAYPSDEPAADHDGAGDADQLGVGELHAGRELRAVVDQHPQARPRPARRRASAPPRPARPCRRATTCTSAGATSSGQSRPRSSWCCSAIAATARETPMP